MARLYDAICSKISSQYHDRMEEILLVLDTKATYDIKVTKNLAIMKRNLQMQLAGDPGYEVLEVLYTPLSGIFKKPGRDFKLEGDFIVVLVKTRLLNPNTRSTEKRNALLIYEKGECLIDKIREVI